jgi:hypothetical protein
MTGIRDKADEADGPEVFLTSSLDDAPAAQIASTELLGADEVTPEDQFPEFGEFLEMRQPDGETVYWECATSLADVVVDAVEESPDGSVLPGTRVDVDMTSKAPSGEWRYVIDLDPSETLQDSSEE